MDLVITNHAYMRLKERNGWSKKTSDRMINKVCKEGIWSHESNGYVRHWINYMEQAHNDEDSIYILYGEKAFVFCNWTLITVMNIPSRTEIIAKYA